VGWERFEQGTCHRSPNHVGAGMAGDGATAHANQNPLAPAAGGMNPSLPSPQCLGRRERPAAHSVPHRPWRSRPMWSSLRPIPPRRGRWRQQGAGIQIQIPHRSSRRLGAIGKQMAVRRHRTNNFWESAAPESRRCLTCTRSPQRSPPAARVGGGRFAAASPRIRRQETSDEGVAHGRCGEPTDGWIRSVFAQPQIRGAGARDARGPRLQVGPGMRCRALGDLRRDSVGSLFSASSFQR